VVYKLGFQKTKRGRKQTNFCNPRMNHFLKPESGPSSEYGKPGAVSSPTKHRGCASSENGFYITVAVPSGCNRSESYAAAMLGEMELHGYGVLSLRPT